ncbi:MAG: 23S rRNA (guanine(745)-N(1))-methyltransferase [Methyloprofundus sp.]|nr:23S rRNA (guanine(745)-N(1))-methyltransferase [Methyloprofundus sp.]MDT8426201.1 23S rRNA (guanine(745)-N(1))-methyltransferase [Methyloprofundus sp.]
MPYICPICQTSLLNILPAQSYECVNNHRFDIAKEGYINLLPAQHKKSKEPGDSKEMMRARRNFLEAGFYQPLAQAISSIIDQYLADIPKLHILDMGCGEGYYSRQIERLAQHRSLDLHGLDIAKNAILAAAKKQPTAQFIVASSERMPYSNDYFNLLLRIYAPSNNNEIKRLLKTNGYLLTVTPGPRHLWQLKEFIYQDTKEHDTQAPLPEGFTNIAKQKVSYTISPDQKQRMALLQMTPFAWRATEQATHAIEQIQDLDIETDFILTLAVKN